MSSNRCKLSKPAFRFDKEEGTGRPSGFLTLLWIKINNRRRIVQNMTGKSTQAWTVPLPPAGFAGPSALSSGPIPAGIIKPDYPERLRV